MDFIIEDRGLYKWRGQEQWIIPAPTLPLRYQRYMQGDMLVNGEWDFSVIERDLDAANQVGEKMIIGVRYMKDTIKSDPTESGKYCVGIDGTTNANGVFIPDWTSDSFLRDQVNLLRAMGKKYNSDPRVVGVQILGLGTFGEWVEAGAELIDQERAEALIDLNRWCFPDKQLYFKIRTKADWMKYALSFADMGWFFNGLGDPTETISDEILALAMGRENMAEWKSPTKMESHGWGYITALQQVKDWGIKKVSNGGLRTSTRKTWDDMPAEDQAAILDIACYLWRTGKMGTA